MNASINGNRAEKGKQRRYSSQSQHSLDVEDMGSENSVSPTFDGNYELVTFHLMSQLPVCSAVKQSFY